MKIEAGYPVAIPWYEDEKSYLEVLNMLPASERQDPFSYDTFITNIKRHEQEIKRTGGITYRIPINTSTLKGWCDANNLQVCRKSIAEYITIALGLLIRSSGRN